MQEAASMQDTNTKLHSSDPYLQVQKMVKRVLVVEDDETYFPFWVAIFKLIDPKIQMSWARTEEEAEMLIYNQYRFGNTFEIVVADIYLAGQRTGVDLWNRFGDTIKHFMFISNHAISESLLDLHPMYKKRPLYLKKPLSAGVCQDVIKKILKL